MSELDDSDWPRLFIEINVIHSATSGRSASRYSALGCPWLLNLIWCNVRYTYDPVDAYVLSWVGLSTLPPKSVSSSEFNPVGVLHQFLAAV